MTAAAPQRPVDRVMDYLADIGPRWGLPADACRVHGYLYLVAQPVTEKELRTATGLTKTALAQALSWLVEYRLVERVQPDAWRTESDPWELMMRALQERQRREVGPALQLLRECQRGADAGTGQSRAVANQIGKLLRLVEDIAAINGQARRFSPATMRRMVGLGGFAARVLDATFATSSVKRGRS